jgi:glutamine cyclotransferase
LAWVFCLEQGHLDRHEAEELDEYDGDAGTVGTDAHNGKVQEALDEKQQGKVSDWFSSHHSNYNDPFHKGGAFGGGNLARGNHTVGGNFGRWRNRTHHPGGGGGGGGGGHIGAHHFSHHGGNLSFGSLNTTVHTEPKNLPHDSSSVTKSTVSDTPAPAMAPTPEPTPGTTPGPTPESTDAPTPEPTPETTPGPTPESTDAPTPEPTPGTTPGPTPESTDAPTPEPTPGTTPGPTPESTDGLNLDSTDWLNATITKGSGVMYEIVEQLPHDPKAFTQGLTFFDGRLYESTGLYRESTVRELDPVTGNVLSVTPLEDQYFGEGMAYYDGKLIQITWKAGVGFVYDANDLSKPPEKFTYKTTKHNEGWGITFDPDNNELIVSDGSNNLMFWDPETFETLRTIPVFRIDGSIPARAINELEFWRGRIIANIWYEDVLVVINPATGIIEKEYGKLTVKV